MKVNGVEVKGAAEEYLVLPRPGGQDIVFHARAVLSFDEFNQKVPMPKPRGVLKAGGWEEMIDDPKYQKALVEYNKLQFAYTFLKSLEPSNIEWETIKWDQPSTWANWRQELIDNQFSPTEINRIVNCVSSANSLDEELLEEARQSFLRGLAKASSEPSSPGTEQSDTQSGKPASGSESDPQE